MEGFELNKILGGVLAAILLITAVRLAASVIYDPGATTGLPGPEIAAASATTASAAKIQPIAALLKSANLERGQRVSKKCISCHSFDKGGANRIGPNLWNIVNRKTGSIENFGYSAAMKKHGGKWGYEELAAFLAKPRKYVSGTIMSFAGLRKPKDRAAIIFYLRSLSDKPPALP